MRIKKAIVLLLALLCLPLSGCLLQSAEELYALPKQSAEYYTLQNQLESVLRGGAEYCAPISGDRRQAVQLADLDSDGQEEAIAFLRIPGEKPLKIYIYKKTDEGYVEYARIEGDGSAFESVDYRQIDTTLGLELVVGRQVSDQVPQTLSAYSVEEGHVTELLNVSCIRYTLADLDANGLQELLVFHGDEDSLMGLTEYYRWGEGGLSLAGSASMSAALTSDSIRRIVYGMMQDDTPAVFVANTYEEMSIVTDVFVLDDEVFTNVSALGGGANDATRVRYRSVYAEDIDGDGLIELPHTVQLSQLWEDDPAPYYKIQWYNLRRDGSRVYKQATFHNYSDGWYLSLRPNWEKTLAVDYGRDAQQLLCYRFYSVDAVGKTQQRFAIYAFNTDDTLILEEGRFVLGEKGDAVYAGQIMDERVTQQELKDAFHFISTDWNSGEV